eukprot:403375388
MKSSTLFGFTVLGLVALIEVKSTIHAESLQFGESLKINYGETLSFESSNGKGMFWRHQNGLLHRQAYQNDEQFKHDASFHIEKCLNSFQSGFTFKSVNIPNNYIRHSYGVLQLMTDDNSAQFKEDSCFVAVPGYTDQNAISFQAYNYPHSYVRHSDNNLKLDTFDNNHLFKEDATWYPRQAFAAVQDNSLETNQVMDKQTLQSQQQIQSQRFENGSPNEMTFSFVGQTSGAAKGLKILVSEVAADGSLIHQQSHQITLGSGQSQTDSITYQETISVPGGKTYEVSIFADRIDSSFNDVSLEYKKQYKHSSSHHHNSHAKSFLQ